MTRSRSVPSYRKHKSSGQAVVTVTDSLGGRRDVLLGNYGTQASRMEYARVLAEWEASGRQLPLTAAAADLTINELIVRFWAHAEQHYRRPRNCGSISPACGRSSTCTATPLPRTSARSP